MVAWAKVASDFAWDGTWRDVVVPDSGLADWVQFLGAVRTRRWPSEYRVNGQSAELSILTEFLAVDETRLLTILFLANGLNCHLWMDGELELDFLPTDIADQSSLDSLGGFCVQLASLLNKPVTVTHENEPDTIILRHEPDGRAGFIEEV